jgi:hypothetical protein
MTDTHRCVDEQGRAVVEDPEDRVSLARGWLLMSAKDPGVAHREWQDLGVALVECGQEFGVVRMEADIVWAATGRRRMVEVDEVLAEVLGGPVFMSLYPHRYYALVPVEAARRYEWAVQRQRHVRYLGEGSVVGVPLVGLTAPDGSRPYWCVPVGEPGHVCSADAVSAFLARGRQVLEGRGEGV